MKHYIRTKQVMAEPVNEQAAVAKGFARKNTDRSTYDSWSPRQVFELSCRQSKTFLDRMHIEFVVLDNRTQRLEAFVKTDKFYHLGAIQQGRLMRQLSAMQQYREWLRLRIEDCEQQVVSMRQSKRRANLLYKLRRRGIQCNTKERCIFLPYAEQPGSYPQISRLCREFHFHIQLIIV